MDLPSWPPLSGRLIGFNSAESGTTERNVVRRFRGCPLTERILGVTDADSCERFASDRSVGGDALAGRSVAPVTLRDTDVTAGDDVSDIAEALAISEDAVLRPIDSNFSKMHVHNNIFLRTRSIFVRHSVCNQSIIE
jgi:hypothetical protein